MYSTILHATDLSEVHFKLCEQAVKIAKHFKAKLYLLHVIQPPATLQIAQGLGFAAIEKPLKNDAQTVMNVLGETFQLPAEQLMVEIGSIKHTILDKARSLDAQLIVIGSHTPSHLPSYLGSTALAVTHHAPCDVLTIRTEELI